MRTYLHLTMTSIGLVAALVAHSGARAESFNLDTTDGPLWDRPLVTGTETTGELTPYFALPFAVSASGDYTIRATPQISSFDVVLFLYDATFAPATPLVGYLAGEDIFSDGGAEQFNFSLTSGATYHAITTGYTSAYYGPYVLSITGPGNISVVEPPQFLPGDFTENHSVDAADLAAWKNGFDDELPATHMQGDADGDFDVDGNDFLVWQRDLGRPDAALAASATVPEPSAALLLITAMMFASAAPRGRRQAAIRRPR